MIIKVLFGNLRAPLRYLFKTLRFRIQLILQKFQFCQLGRSMRTVSLIENVPKAKFSFVAAVENMHKSNILEACEKIGPNRGTKTQCVLIRNLKVLLQNLPKKNYYKHVIVIFSILIGQKSKLHSILKAKKSHFFFFNDKKMSVKLFKK